MSAPSTPATGQRTAPSTPGGSWRHPAMDRIVERRKQKGLADTNHRRLMWNILALFLSFAVDWFWDLKFVRALPLIGRPLGALVQHLVFKDLQWLVRILLWTLRLLFVYNAGEAAFRLTRPDPDFSDLALTADQRWMLGLDPNVVGNTADILTPPRFPLTVKSKKDASDETGNSPHVYPTTSSPSSSFASNTSMFSPSPNATITRQRHYSADPPMTPSPLRTAQRGSVGSSLGFSVHAGTSSPLSGSIFNTPSPINRLAGGSGATSAFGAGGSSVPVGGRWVYEKLGRRGEGMRFSPSKNSLYAINSPTRGA
ncbi:nuclear pore complex component-domain-containing protein [Peziza echinospora]|nr:nuclear pore complex component-domain-containing protein [Peziza echinospora]